MTTDIKELVKRLRAWNRDVLGADGTFGVAADAIEALAGEVERWKKNHEALQDKIGCMKSCGCAYDAAGDICGHHSPKLIAAEAERDRLKAALDVLSAVRGDLPEKVSEQWLYEGVRHWHRNCEWDEPTDGCALDRHDGAAVAKILNMIPRKALGDAS